MASKFIASIYPIVMQMDRPLYNGRFRMPAAERGKPPVMFEIRDHFQNETLPWIFAPQGAARQSQRRERIMARDIAVDCIKHWTQGLPDQNPASRPGIWIVRDEIPLYKEDGITPDVDAEGAHLTRPATPEEKAEMFAEDLAESQAAQDMWAETCIMYGDMIWETSKTKDARIIPSYCKILCRYYGRERIWLQSLRDRDVKECKFCTKSIPSRATVCEHCGRDQGQLNQAPQPVPHTPATESVIITPKEPAPKQEEELAAVASGPPDPSRFRPNIKR